MLQASDLFDLNTCDYAELFQDTHYVWEAIPKLAAYIQHRLDTDLKPNASAYELPPGSAFGNDQIYIAPSARLDPGVYIEGPAIIGPDCRVIHGAYVRANTLMARGSIIGHATEVKNSLLLNDAHAPHFAYVGDSLLGQRVNLGAGTKLSNLAVNSAKDPATGARPTIHLTLDGQRVDTGLAKMGAILGDDAQTGCNSVTNPGTIIGARTLVYPLMSVKKGYYPADSIVKLRQMIEVTERR